jgi:hypothetical protein
MHTHADVANKLLYVLVVTIVCKWYTRDTPPVWGASNRLIGTKQPSHIKAGQAQKRLSSTVNAL